LEIFVFLKLVAIFQLLNSSCIIRNLKPAVQRHGFYTFYLELPNGTRLRQMADVVYDERQGWLNLIFLLCHFIQIILNGLFFSQIKLKLLNLFNFPVQVYFFHGFLIAIVLPGFFMPFLLHLAERRVNNLLHFHSLINNSIKI
jgi:hypothetical protein